MTPPQAALVTPADEENEYHIEAQTSLVERSLRTLKHGDAFAVLDAYGDIGTEEGSAEGLFFRDMRHLSRLQFWFANRRPLLLSSVIQDDNTALCVDLTNPDIEAGDGVAIDRDTVAFDRLKFLWDDACFEHIAVRNFDARRRRFQVGFNFDADFKDLFEVRGVNRLRRGTVTSRVDGPDKVELSYRGLDGRVRRTRLQFSPAPQRLDARRATFDLTLDGHARTSIAVAVVLDEGETERTLPKLATAYRQKRRAIKAGAQGIATIATSNDLLNQMLCQSTADLHMLLTETGHGRYPYAGIPWYSTVFGRDGIITAMMALWLDPTIAKGVLTYLAATQAQAEDPAADAQPGKILHERRQGEMALLGEVPFKHYYGTVDATPLFVMLAGMYFERTGDRATLEAIWPNIKAALHWIDTYGDRDRDGFVEYFRETPHGLANQGWKDSHDSIFHADGSSAEGPIALVEVQAYVYAAKAKAAALATLFGDEPMAKRLRDEARLLREAFDAAFWCDEIATYALALDGEKRQCRVRTSNAGHALMAGIAEPARASLVAASLLGRAGSSGWGIRTLAHSEPRYNPLSYHNGSVWPHDNAMVAIGLGRYGLKREAAQVFEAIFAAGLYQDDSRLPELFCGFPRRARRGPTAYPVACSPQAWAAATPFALLAACLGISVDHHTSTINVMNPVLPAFLNEVTITNLDVADSKVDLRFDGGRPGGGVAVDVLAQTGAASIVIRK